MTDEEVALKDEEQAPSSEEMTDEQKEMARLKEAVRVQIEEVGTLRKKLTITVPKETIAERRSEQFNEIKKDSVVPGFRRGRAPMRLIEKRFGPDVNLQLSSQLLSSSYLAAVEKESIKAIGDPLIWVKDKKAEAEADAAEKLVSVEEAFDCVVISPDGDFTYSCEIEVRPEFELPALEEVSLDPPNIVVSDEDVRQYLDRLRMMRGHFEPVPGEPVQDDDLVSGSLKITVGNEVLLEEENCQLAARPTRYSGIVMEDFGKVVHGARTGDKKSFSITIPDDYTNEAVRSQGAAVEFQVQEIKRLRLPEVDEAFLKTLGFSSQPELEKWLRMDLESRRSEEVKRGLKDQVSKYLIGQTAVDLPENLSQRQADRIASRRMLEMSQRGIPESEIVKHLDEIRAGAQTDAVGDLKLQFVFEKIAEQWKIEVSEDEINGYIAGIAQRQNRRFDRVRDDLIRTKTIASLYVFVRDEKIVDRIIEKAKMTESSKPSPKK